MSGKPTDDGAIVTLSSRSRRPVESSCAFFVRTKCSSRAKKDVRSKYEPVKLKLNGIADRTPPATGTEPGAEASSPSAGGVAAVGLAPPRPVPSSIFSNVTPLRSAVPSTWTISERMSSSPGTALPRRASVA
jgi:hypothetical protein